MTSVNAQSGSSTWTGEVDSDFYNPGNWTGADYPNGNATFSGTVSNTNISRTSDTYNYVYGLIFANTEGTQSSFTLVSGGTTVNLGGPVISTSAVTSGSLTDEIGVNVNLPGNSDKEFRIRDNHDLHISGNLTAGRSDRSIVKTEAGTLILSGANTAVSQINISGGTLQLGDGSTGGSLNTTSTITVASGATFSINQSDTVTQGTDFSGAAISGAGSFEVKGGGTVVLINSETFDDADSSVSVASDSFLNLNFSGTEVVGSLDLGAGPVSGVYGAIGSDAANTSERITGTGKIRVPASLTWDGSDDQTWSGPSDSTSWSGQTYLDLDTANFSDTGAGTVTISGAVAPEAITVDNSAGNDYTFSGDAITSDSLTKNGAGSLTIANSYTGALVFEEGTIEVSGQVDTEVMPSVYFGNVLDVSGDMTITAPSGAVHAPLEGAGTFNLTGNLNLNGTATSTVFKPDLTISGNGTLSVPDRQFTFYGNEINLEGQGPDIEIQRLNTYWAAAGNECTIKFNLDAGGVRKFAITNYAHLAFAYIEVDGSNYTGGPGTIPLITSPNLASMPISSTITGGFSGLNSEIVRSGNDLVLNLTTDTVYWDGSDDQTWTGSSDSTSWSGQSYNQGGTVEFSDTGAGTVTISGAVAATSILVNNSAGNDYTFTGDALSSETLTKEGAGTLTIDNSYTGTVVFEEGTIEVSGQVDTEVMPSVYFGNVLDVSGDMTITAPSGTSQNHLEGAGTINLTGNLTLDGTATATRFKPDLTISGNGTLSAPSRQFTFFGNEVNLEGQGPDIELDKLNTAWAGAGNESTIKFNLDAGGVRKIACTGYMRLAHSIIEVDGTNYTGGPGTITLISSSDSGGENPSSATITGAFSGLNSEVTLSGDNLVVVLTAPAVVWDGSDDQTWTGPSDSTSWSGDSYDSSKYATFGDAGAGTVTISGTVEPSGMIVDASADYTFTGGSIGGLYDITKSGSGTLTLDSANTYSGVTYISEGTLVMGDDAALGDTTGNTVVSGGSLRVEGGITIADDLSLSGGSPDAPALWNIGNNTVTGAITGGGRIQSEAADSVLTISGGITNAGTLVGDIVIDTNPVTTGILYLAGDSYALGDEDYVGGRQTVLGPITGTHDWNITILFFDANLQLGATDILPTDTILKFGWADASGSYPTANAYSKAKLDLNGYDQTVGSLETHGSSLGLAGDAEITGTSGTLTTTQEINTEFQGRLTGGISLVKAGTGTLTLNNLSGTPSSYTGSTTVSAGTLVLSSADLDDASTVSIADGAVLNLTHSDIDDVAVLNFDGVAQASGTYDASNSGGYITGTGSIRVGGAAAPYTTWVSGFTGLTDTSTTLDFDGGSLESGMEYVLGGDPTDASDDISVAPTSSYTGSALEFEFRRTDTANDDSNTTIVVEYGSDLSGWTTAEHDTDGVSITVTDDHYATGVDRVVVSLPDSLAVEGKIFARLKVTTSL